MYLDLNPQIVSGAPDDHRRLVVRFPELSCEQGVELIVGRRAVDGGSCLAVHSFELVSDDESKAVHRGYLTQRAVDLIDQHIHDGRFVHYRAFAPEVASRGPQ